MIRLLLAITCGGFVGCGMMTEDRDKDMGMIMSAECGNCEVCKLVVEGEGTETRQRKSANIEEAPTMD